jgi:Tfp pilus assembly protein PilZ
MSQAESNFENRRRHERIATEVEVRISTIEPERDPWTGRPFFRASFETCANVSRGGAFVKTAEPLSPGRRLLVEVHLPGTRPIEAIGRVAWTKRIIAPEGADPESGIGIEFIGGASYQLAALDGYIETLQSDPTADES